jgi:hypothetical protein
VLESALRLAALVCAALVLTSFGLFARDQFSGASENQQRELSGGSAQVVAPPARHGQPRRFIDGAADALESPFAAVVSSSSDWVDHALPALLGLLVYGAGLGFAARYAHGRV